MTSFNKQRVSVLICADPDANTATKLAEKYIPFNPIFDLVILSGPFCHKSIESLEDTSIAEGDMASIIAQFENIVCRVVYLAAETDPVNSIVNQIHLTPNSLNIHARKLGLLPHFFITGFTEKSEQLEKRKVTSGNDQSEESDEELENVEVQSGISLSLINEILQNGAKMDGNTISLDSTAKENGSGIFMMNFKFSHTLNQLLFHMQEQLNDAGISICIVNCVDSKEICSRLPPKFGNLNIIVPKSLRKEGCYTKLILKLNSNLLKWELESVETLKL